MQRLVLTEEDFESERRLYEKEKIFPVNDEKMFQGGVWCIISAAEKWQKLEKMYQELLEKSLITPDAIIGNQQEVQTVLDASQFKNKFKRVYGFADWWKKTDLSERIREDIQNERRGEFELRDELVNEAPGMGPKCSSYFLNLLGYENVVAVDKWMLTFLRNRGYKYNRTRVKVPDFETIGGPRGKEFMTYERMAQNLARRYSVTPAQFQRIIWIRYSDWKS